jgi:hypothetical protein
MRRATAFAICSKSVLVEKDCYVVRAIAAINAADVNPFRLGIDTAKSRTAD